MVSSTAEHSMSSPKPHRVMILGGTGTIGQAVVRELIRRQYEVVCLVRNKDNNHSDGELADRSPSLNGAIIRYGDITDSGSLARDGFRGEPFNALVSCLASRTGNPKDAWKIDYQAHVDALAASRVAGLSHIVLLSAICVQKPLLEFQKAKLAFEKILIESGITYSIVRPTAFFKSLSGQIDRVRRGKPFLLFGNGTITSCKPISDDDLGRYIADCLVDMSLHNRVLPIGGPGSAITPKQQGEYLFALLGKKPKFTHIPVAFLDMIIWTLRILGNFIPRLSETAELARIGRYYATESMLVLNPKTGQYDADATPSTGIETLKDFYSRLICEKTNVDRGDHAVF